MLETCGGSGTHNKTIVLHGTLKLKQQTNADRIRSMTDEELAEEMGTTIDRCPPSSTICPTGRCQDCWLCWLKQEVESNDS